MQHSAFQSAFGRPGGSARGFTLVELLVVIAVIIILLSLLIVGLNVAKKTAQTAKTRSVMTALSQGVVQFKTDHGYLPPVLDNERSLVASPNPNDPMYGGIVQQWASIVSPAEYLIGWDAGSRDGYGDAAIGETPFAGIRSPGPDGVWGAGEGPIRDRNPVNLGRVFGPYITLDDERLLGGLTPNGRIVFPSEDANFSDYPKVIVDTWGEPIEYYRRPYPVGVLTQSYRSLDYDGDGEPDRVPKLSDVIVLRPYQIIGDAASNSIILDGNQDPTSSYSLDAAEFAFFSPGPDQFVDRQFRVDTKEWNRDNIVETGP